MNRPTLLASAVLVLTGTALYAGCRKPPPEELVYAGQGGGTSSQGGSGGSTPASGGSAGSPSDAGLGDAGPSSGEAFNGIPSTAPNVPFSKQALLQQVGACITAHSLEFRQRSQVLTDQTAELDAANSDEARSSARSAWLSAMAIWQQLEVMQVGPAATSLHPGGKDLRDSIYAWPLVSRCRVEEQLVEKSYTAADFSSSLITGRTLGALEYLLFYQGTDNECSQFSPINGPGGWSELSADELGQRKAAYAKRAAQDVLENATALQQAWSPSGGNFSAQLSQPGSGGSPYTSTQQALNAVSDALFYVDLILKDQKLGRPAGIAPDCQSNSCPEAVESPFAQASTSHLRENLRGFRRIYQGCYLDNTGLGFDDWLIAAGATNIEQDLTAALGQADAAVGALPGPLENVLSSDLDKVRAAHAAVKRVTDILKTEFVTVLNLELPKVAEGDND